MGQDADISNAETTIKGNSENGAKAKAAGLE